MNANTASILNILVSKLPSKKRERLIDMIDEDNMKPLAKALSAVANNEPTEGLDEEVVNAAKGMYKMSFAYNPKKSTPARQS